MDALRAVFEFSSAFGLLVFTSRITTTCRRPQAKDEVMDGYCRSPCFSTSKEDFLAKTPTQVLGQTGTHCQLVGKL
uniref:Uncharacterized protein n=1 Tax=Iconisemion striatum TaxID=60296 RepID=A0A1A7Y4E1_9TELE